MEMQEDAHWTSCQTRLRYKYRKRTRTVFSNLEDHYLRGDISCGYPGCPCCPTPASTALTPQVPYICIPDAPALLDFLEVWEMQDLSNIVICTSVLQKLAILGNQRKVSKIRVVYRDLRRHVYLFDDLHCQWITSNREADPSKLLPEVARFYWDHLDHAVPIIVMSDRLAAQADSHGQQALTQQLQQLHLDDAAAASSTASGTAGAAEQQLQHLQQQQQQVLCQGLSFLSPAAFFGLFFGGSQHAAVYELFDSLLQAKHDKEQRAAAIASGDPEAAAQAAAASQELKPHWSHLMVEEGLLAGELLQGVLHVSLRNPREAVVQVGNTSANSALGRLVRVSGRQACNRALHGDTVAVRLLPQANTRSAQQSSPEAAAQQGEDGTAMATDRENGEEGSDEEAGVDSAAQIVSDAGAMGGGVDDGAELVGGGEAAGEDEGAAAVLSSSDQLELLPLGEVVAVLQRSTHSVVSCLAQQEEEALIARAGGGVTSRQEAVLVVPYDRRLPFIRIRTRAATSLVGQRFVVRVDGWDRVSRYPDGHMVKVIGPINDMRAESESVLEHTGITWQPFCSGALAELPAVPGGDPRAWTVPQSERELRRDLTGPEYFVVSIDPVGCTDVDDALHVRALPDGRVEVGVHIADVSYFVRAGSMLDGEAKDRCTSVYLVDRRLDMLPSLLSEQLCSLRQHCERLAVSVIWTLDPHTLAVQDVWYGRTIIRSRHQLHYQQAQDIVDNRPPAPGDELPTQDRQILAWALSVLVRLTAGLHAERVANGALELSSSELRFQTDEKGQPVAVKAKPKVPMMDVVAEMMIWTNAAVARRTAGAFPGAALLRNHPPPREEAFEQVKAVLEQGALGPSSKVLANVDPTNNQSLSKALEDACRQASGKDAAVAQLLKSLTTRAMSEAKYFSTGAAAPGSSGAYHYGLALQYYTHFTSPIRRYADVVAHRQLLAALELSKQMEQQGEQGRGQTLPPPIPHSELMIMADRMNEQHRASKAAQKECMELYLLLLLHSQPHVESALLVGIQGRDQLDVFVPSIQMRGRVRMVDAKGGVRTPLTGAEGQQEALATSQSLKLVVSDDKHSLALVDCLTGQTIWSAAVLERLWLMLDADGSRAHGPRLRMRLAATTHPMVREKQAEQQQAAQEAGSSTVQAAPTPPPPSISPAAQQMLALKGIVPPAPSASTPPTAQPVKQINPRPPPSSAAPPPPQPACAAPLPPIPSLQSMQPSGAQLSDRQHAQEPIVLTPPQQSQEQLMTEEGAVRVENEHVDGTGNLPDVQDVMQGGREVPEALQACLPMPPLPGDVPQDSAKAVRHCQAITAKYEARIAKASLRRAARHKQAWGHKLRCLQEYIASTLPWQAL